MILMAQSVPSAESSPASPRSPPGGSWVVSQIDDERARFWLDSDGGGDHAVEATLLPPDRLPGRAVRPRCRATRPGCAGSSGSEQLPPHLRSTADYMFPGGCVVYRFACTARETRVRSADADERARVPAARVRSSTRSAQSDHLRCAARAPRAPEDRDDASRCSVVGVLSPRARRARRSPSSATALVAATARHPPRLGHRADLRRHRVGRRGAPRVGARRLGLGGRRPPAAHARDRHPGDDGGRGRARPARPARARSRSASGPGLVVAPRPLRAVRRRIAVLRRYRELVRLARREGFGPFLSAGAGRSVGRGGRGPAPPGARGGRRRLRQARSDRGDARRPPAARRLRRARQAAEPGRRRAGRAIRPVLEAELGGPVDEVFAEFDWEPLAAASIGQTYRARLRIGRGRGREGAATGHRRTSSSATSPRSRYWPTSRSGARRSAGAPIGRDARAVRAEPARRARLPARGRRDGARWPCCSAPTTACGCPRVYGEFCTRRLLVQEHFDGFTVADTDELDAPAIDRTLLAEELLRADARPGAAASGSSTPIPTRGTSSSSPMAPSA